MSLLFNSMRSPANLFSYLPMSQGIGTGGLFYSSAGFHPGLLKRQSGWVRFIKSPPQQHPVPSTQPIRRILY